MSVGFSKDYADLLSNINQRRPSFSPRKSALSSCGFSVSQANIFTMRKACAGGLGKRQSGEQNLKETDGSVSDSQM